MKPALFTSCLAKISISAAFAVALFFPQVATAAGAPSATSSAPALFNSPAKADSQFLAGYRTKKTVTEVLSASNTFTVPNLTCFAGPEGIALGIGNEKKKGKPTLLAVVFVACINGLPYYVLSTVAGENSSAGTTGTVLAGHEIQVQITQDASTVTATVKDTNTSETVTATGTSLPDTALTFGAFPLFVGKTMLSVPEFGSVQIRSNKLNGVKIDKEVQAVPRTNGLDVQIAVEKLKKGNFTLTFAHH